MQYVKGLKDQGRSNMIKLEVAMPSEGVNLFSEVNDSAHSNVQCTKSFCVLQERIDLILGWFWHVASHVLHKVCFAKQLVEIVHIVSSQLNNPALLNIFVRVSGVLGIDPRKESSLAPAELLPLQVL